MAVTGRSASKRAKRLARLLQARQKQAAYRDEARQMRGIISGVSTYNAAVESHGVGAESSGSQIGAINTQQRAASQRFKEDDQLRTDIAYNANKAKRAAANFKIAATIVTAGAGAYLGAAGASVNAGSIGAVGGATTTSAAGFLSGGATSTWGGALAGAQTGFKIGNAIGEIATGGTYGAVAGLGQLAEVGVAVARPTAGAPAPAAQPQSTRGGGTLPSIAGGTYQPDVNASPFRDLA